MADGFDVLKKGMRIDHEQEGFLIRVLWVLAVSGHIAWVCGFLGFIGLHSPFVAASDLTQFKSEQVSKLDSLISKQEASERLLMRTLAQGKAREIRETLTRICTAKTSAEKARLNEDKDRLQDEYLSLTGGRFNEAPCEQLR